MSKWLHFFSIRGSVSSDKCLLRLFDRGIRLFLNIVSCPYFNLIPFHACALYQMLKAAYSLRGYEALLLDYTDALFIFDEIHAYDPKRLALIIETIAWLREHFHARFMVMTATLPPMVREKLEQALPDHDVIEADSSLYKASQRHRVHLRDGDMLEDLQHILADVLDGQSVLICCNQVSRAQTVYKFFREHLGAGKITLLHGRFNGKDRNDKEQQLLEKVGVRSDKRVRPYVVVATQAVEVSLDIDLDTLYTDPAPLEALLQRFGRVNRGRSTQEICPVHVYREPSMETMPYEPKLIQASLAELEQIDGCNIDEAQVTAMLEHIYQGEIRANWLAEYDRQVVDFKRFVLDKMQPFTSADLDLHKRFYSMFDGIDLLPADCRDDYDKTLDTVGYLAASQYFVNISTAQYYRLRGKKYIQDRDIDDNEHMPPTICKPYSPEYGLELEE